MPVEVKASDLVRLGLLSEDETLTSLKKPAQRLIREGFVKSFRASTGLFMLEQKSDRSCVFLDSQRRCTVYEKRPEVCRLFPVYVGPKVGYCPAKRLSTQSTNRGAASGSNRKNNWGSNNSNSPKT